MMVVLVVASVSVITPILSVYPFYENQIPIIDDLKNITYHPMSSKSTTSGTASNAWNFFKMREGQNKGEP